MNKSEADKIIKSATVTERGDRWGDPLWQVSLPTGSVDVHATSEDDARKKASEYLQEEEA